MSSIKNDFSIELVRVVAMFMIIFDHILLLYDYPFHAIVSQLLNSGIYIFVFISGYLFGKQKIENWWQWYYKRFCRIFIPFWIVVLMDAIYQCFVVGDYKCYQFIVHVFGMQGFGGYTSCTETLWFVTLIIILYAITPAIDFIDKHVSKIGKLCILITVVFFQVWTAFYVNYGMISGHDMSWCIIAVLIYSVAYCMKKDIQNYLKIKKMAVLSVGLIAMIVVNILVRASFDGDIIYDRVASVYCMLATVLYFMLLVYEAGNHIHSKLLVNTINRLNGISYEMYLVHKLVIVTITFKFLYSVNALLYVVMSVALSYAMALIINKLTMVIDKTFFARKS